MMEHDTRHTTPKIFCDDDDILISNKNTPPLLILSGTGFSDLFNYSIPQMLPLGLVDHGVFCSYLYLLLVSKSSCKVPVAPRGGCGRQGSNNTWKGTVSTINNNCKTGSYSS